VHLFVYLARYVLRDRVIHNTVVHVYTLSPIIMVSLCLYASAIIEQEALLLQRNRTTRYVS